MADALAIDGFIFIALAVLIMCTVLAEEVFVCALRRSYARSACRAGEHCVICLLPLAVRDCGSACALSCGHVFHRRCVAEWMQTSPRNCPLCRADDPGLVL